MTGQLRDARRGNKLAGDTPLLRLVDSNARVCDRIVNIKNTFFFSSLSCFLMGAKKRSSTIGVGNTLCFWRKKKRSWREHDSEVHGGTVRPSNSDDLGGGPCGKEVDTDARAHGSHVDRATRLDGRENERVQEALVDGGACIGNGIICEMTQPVGVARTIWTFVVVGGWCSIGRGARGRHGRRAGNTAGADHHRHDK